MGFWGTGLYSNDSTCDVRDTYKGFLCDQLSNEEAYRRTLEQYQELIGSDEEPLFWYALAETQWRVGRLTPEVKDITLEWIDRGGALDLWENESSGINGWKKTLIKLGEKLESPMPKEKRFPKIDMNPWQLHDVYAYQLHGEEAIENGMDGKYMLLQKMSEEEHYHGGRRVMQMQLHAIDHVFNEMPKLDDINRYRILPIGTPPRQRPEGPLVMNGYIYMEKPSEYPKKHLTFLGNKPGPANSKIALFDMGWYIIDNNLVYNYLFWKDKEYIEVEKGIYEIAPETLWGDEFSLKSYVTGINGFGPYDSDMAQALADLFSDTIVNKCSDEERDAIIKKEFRHYIGTYMEPLFWYVYAYEQWYYMRPTQEVRDKALEWLAKDGGMEIWDDNHSREGWRKTLDWFRMTFKTWKRVKT